MIIYSINVFPVASKCYIKLQRVSWVVKKAGAHQFAHDQNAFRAAVNHTTLLTLNHQHSSLTFYPAGWIV